jgi:hypothetical protein
MLRAFFMLDTLAMIFSDAAPRCPVGPRIFRKTDFLESIFSR